jgi:hypothetical protein
VYRHQLHVQVRVGQWREYYGQYEKLDKLVRAKKLVPTKLFGVTFGALNAAVLVTDYESLDAFDRNIKAFQKDAETMGVWREMGKLVDGIPWDEMWESAYQIA